MFAEIPCFVTSTGLDQRAFGRVYGAGCFVPVCKCSPGVVIIKVICIKKRYTAIYRRCSQIIKKNRIGILFRLSPV
jgi:hypothetical protein